MEKSSIKFYKRNFITDGLVKYGTDDSKDKEVLLLTKEVIDEGLKTFIGKEVLITHEGEDKVGEVVDCYYNTETGNYIVGFNVWDDQAKKLLDDRDFSVSCTYKIKDYEGGGIYHNIPYDKKINGIEFTSLAIVKEPRFQEAKEYINSMETAKENGGKGSGNFGHKGVPGRVGGSAQTLSKGKSQRSKGGGRYIKKTLRLVKKKKEEDPKGAKSSLKVKRYIRKDKDDDENEYNFKQRLKKAYAEAKSKNCIRDILKKYL